MIPWILFGYAVGSVPFAYLLARRAGIDVRVAGSGNVGAANVLRTSGTPLGLAVMVLDIGKGAATVLAAYAGAGSSNSVAAAGAAAIVGHIYPVNSINIVTIDFRYRLLLRPGQFCFDKGDGIVSVFNATL